MMVIVAHLKSLGAFTSLGAIAPFACGGRFAGLELERAEVSQASDPFWGEFEQTGDAAQFGRSWANTPSCSAEGAIDRLFFERVIDAPWFGAVEQISLALSGECDQQRQRRYG
jgi:hypothetical protein